MTANEKSEHLLYRGRPHRVLLFLPCRADAERRESAVRAAPPGVPALRDAGRKTRDFLGFSSFFAVFLTFSKFELKQK